MRRLCAMRPPYGNWEYHGRVIAPRLPPGPPPRRGPFDSLSYYYRFVTDPMGYVATRFERYGDIYYAPSGGVGLYVLKHPDHIHQVLVRDAAKYDKMHSALANISQVLGDGLLTSDGADWRRQRRMVQPAFSKQRLMDYSAAMVTEALRVRARWHDGQCRDINSEMMRLTLSVVGRTLFSRDVGGASERVAAAMEAFHRSLMSPDLVPSWLPSPARRQGQIAAAALDDIIYDLIRERRAAAPPEPPDLLQMLLDAEDREGDGGGLADKEVRDQLVTLFVAGHETTSHALSWTWYLLADNLRAQRRMHFELDTVLGGAPPSYRDLARLPYTRWVINEAMRMFPPAYTVARRAVQDTRIGDYSVAAGSEVIVWIYMTHRDRRWYQQPEVFRPDRFAPAAVAARPKLSYLPFGAGPRTCIGKSFAMIEAQLLLATLAQHYELRMAQSRVEMQPRITLAPKRLRMLIRRRQTLAA